MLNNMSNKRLNSNNVIAQELGLAESCVLELSSFFSCCNFSNCDLRNVLASSWEGNTVLIQAMTFLFSESSRVLTGDVFPSDSWKDIKYFRLYFHQILCFTQKTFSLNNQLITALCLNSFQHSIGSYFHHFSD